MCVVCGHIATRLAWRHPGLIFEMSICELTGITEEQTGFPQEQAAAQ